MTMVAETTYPSSVSGSRVRMEWFVPHLRPLGLDLRYRPTLTEQEYKLIASSASAARKGKAALTAAARLAVNARDGYPRLIYRLRLPVPLPGLDPPARVDVYDFDDALFLGASSTVNRRYARLKRDADRCVTYMRRARLVVVGNAYLADHAKRYARRVEVIPSCVDPWLQPLRDHQGSDVLTVGWIGAPSTSVYLSGVLQAFERYNCGRMRARLVLMGADQSIRADWIEHRRWSVPDETALLSELDIGIMPMPDTDWARGKCGYKLLRYFAAGLPAIASPVGVNSPIVGADRGILASTMTEWVDALNVLGADWKLRREMGAAGRRLVEREYSYQRWAPDLAALLRSA